MASTFQPSEPPPNHGGKVKLSKPLGRNIGAVELEKLNYDGLSSYIEVVLNYYYSSGIITIKRRRREPGRDSEIV